MGGVHVVSIPLQWVCVFCALATDMGPLDALQTALDINRAELYFLINLFMAWPLAYVHR